ncbi:hypothetical protein BS78_10G105700 [Paspalum vaginatum]|nr:hypothetical protein BS78_10G105700 [Paspalum vaginatum]
MTGSGSKVVAPLLLLFVILSSSWTCRPAAAARPLMADDDGARWVDQAPANTGMDIIVLPSVWRRWWHKLPPLEMKPAGASCQTWSPNNPCPPPSKS